MDQVVTVLQVAPDYLEVQGRRENQDFRDWRAWMVQLDDLAHLDCQDHLERRVHQGYRVNRVEMDREVRRVTEVAMADVETPESQV